MVDTSYDSDRLVIRATPIGSAGMKSSGWYGMLAFIVTEALLFVYLHFTYYYMLVWKIGDQFLPDQRPSFWPSAGILAGLVVSSGFMVFAQWAAKRGFRLLTVIGLVVALLLGALFVAVQLLEWADKPYGIADSPYASIYYVLTGWHLFHLVFGLLVLLALIVWAAIGYFDRERHAPVTIGAAYWHFVVVIAVTVFFTLNCTPYLA